MSTITCYAFSAFAQTGSLKVGVDQRSITPLEAKFPHYRGTSTGVHDSLFTKTVVFQDGSKSAAIVICDLLWISRDLSSEVRQHASIATGIPFENILISATHSHTTPAYDDNIRVLNQELRNTEDYPSNPDPYQIWLAKQLIESIQQAYNQLAPVRIRHATTIVPNIAFNRRFILANGQVQMNPGVNNPKAIRTAGQADPTLHLLLFERISDKVTIGSFSNFAVHSDTFGGTLFSADYPGIIAQHLQGKYGQNFVSIFGLGTAGDLNHVDVKNPTNKLTTQLIGDKLGSALLNLSTKTAPVVPQMVAASTTLYAPLQAYSAEELAFAYSNQATLYPDTPFLTKRRKLKIRSLEQMRTQEAIPPTIASEPWHIPLDIQVFTFGKEIAIVGLPGEVFADLGLMLKKQSPYKHTIIIELTNTHIAYVPTREAFKQGSYETINSRLQPGGGELMVQTALALLKELHTNQPK